MNIIEIHKEATRQELIIENEFKKRMVGHWLITISSRYSITVFRSVDERLYTPDEPAYFTFVYDPNVSHCSVIVKCVQRGSYSISQLNKIAGILNKAIVMANDKG